MKSKLKQIIKDIIVGFFSLLPLNKNKILFESNSEIKDNTKSLFNECLRKNINFKYKIVWFVENPSKYRNEYKDIKNVKFVKKTRYNSHSLPFLYHCCTAKYCFYTHIFIGLRKGKGQVKVFLTHGTPIKDTRGLFWNPYNNTDIISTSEFASELRCKTFYGGNDIVRLLGFPRNDNFYNVDDETNKFYNKLNCSKLIVWLPTFKHFNVKDANRNDYQKDCDSDISILSEPFLKKLNDILKKNDSILFIKFHPGQDLNYIKFYEFSNIIMMSNKQLEENKIDLYSLMAKSSALITDFSSVYIDYLLLDRPIGFELNDYEQFKSGRGFLVDNPLEFMPGHKITSEDEFITFLGDIFEQRDIFKKDRSELKKKMHKYCDGNSSERILKYFDIM